MNAKNTLMMTMVLWLVALSTVSAQNTYKSYQDAMREGATLYRQQRYAEAQAPLEAALKLAPNDRERLNVYQALSAVYRQLPEIDKKLEANEYIIRNTERSAGRSLAASDLTSFLFQRGKIDAGIERYETLLKKSPKDLAALTVLSKIYDRAKREPARKAEIDKQLEAAEREVAAQHAERLEQQAAAEPQLAAWHLKDAATFWIEAKDNAKALAAARKSAEGPPESRNEQLACYWRDGLGDVYMAAGDINEAIKQYEAAVAVMSNPVLRKGPEKKLADAKAKLNAAIKP